MRNVVKSVIDFIPEDIKDTTFVRLFGLAKVPMLFYVRPKVVEMNDQKCVIKIPLNRRTKNHLNSMYFGVLCVGADCAGGFAAMKQIINSKKKISLAFKEFNAKFLKRAEGDTYFTCEEGKKISELVETVMNSDERHSTPLKIIATCPDKFGDEPVAEFELILSLKKKS